METDTIPETQEQYTRLCTAKSMDDVTVCISGVSRQGGGGEGW